MTHPYAKHSDYPSKQQPSPSNKTAPTADDYLGRMSADVRASLDHHQLSEVRRLLAIAIPKPSPKIVDLRFTVDLIISRFYVVLFVGKDRRARKRQHRPNPFTRAGNYVAAVALLLSLNLLISLFVFMLAYLMKSAIGIDLFKDGHLIDQVQKF